MKNIKAVYPRLKGDGNEKIEVKLERLAPNEFIGLRKTSVVPRKKIRSLKRKIRFTL